LLEYNTLKESKKSRLKLLFKSYLKATKNTLQ